MLLMNRNSGFSRLLPSPQPLSRPTDEQCLSQRERGLSAEMQTALGRGRLAVAARSGAARVGLWLHRLAVHAPQRGVEPAFGEEFLVGAAFADFAVLDVEDAVGACGEVEVVGNH